MNKVTDFFWGLGIGLAAGIVFSVLYCAYTFISCSHFNEAIYKSIPIFAVIGAIIGLVIGAAKDSEDKAFMERQRLEEIERERQAKIAEEEVRKQRVRAAATAEYENWLERLYDGYQNIFTNMDLIKVNPKISDRYEQIEALRKEMVTGDIRYEQAWNQLKEKHLNELKKSFLQTISRNSVVNETLDYEYDWLNRVVENFNVEGEELNETRISGGLKYAYCDNLLACMTYLSPEEFEKYHHAHIVITVLDDICSRPFLYLTDDMLQFEYGNIPMPRVANENGVLVPFEERHSSHEVVSGERKTDLSKLNEKLKNSFVDFDSAMQYINDEENGILFDMAVIEAAMWLNSTQKPIDIRKLNVAMDLFCSYTDIFGIPHGEAVFAYLCAKNNLGGKELVRSSFTAIDKWLEKAKDGMTGVYFEAVASGLAQMEMYDAELHLLKQLLKLGVHLSSDVQERISFLVNGGTLDIKIYEVDESSDFLYDTSSIDWKPDAFHVFFRRLSMKKMITKYSLVISKWAKNVPLTSGQTVSVELMYQKFAELVLDFDNEVTFSVRNARAVNLLNVGLMNAALFTFDNDISERCRCISVLFSCEKFGRNLNVSMLTLFTPDGRFTAEELENYAMAIKENSYVESFRETVAQVVDEVLNPTQSAYNVTQNTVSKNNVFE